MGELVSGLMRNNYGQPHSDAGALCCFTAVAPLAAGGSRAAFRIAGGNAQLAGQHGGPSVLGPPQSPQLTRPAIRSRSQEPGAPLVAQATLWPSLSSALPSRARLP